MAWVAYFTKSISIKNIVYEDTSIGDICTGGYYTEAAIVKGIGGFNWDILLTWSSSSDNKDAKSTNRDAYIKATTSIKSICTTNTYANSILEINFILKVFVLKVHLSKMRMSEISIPEMLILSSFW